MKRNAKNIPTNSKSPAVEFISRRFETLVAQIEYPPDKKEETKEEEAHFDVVVVGSGYGGSIAASQFASMRKANSNTPLHVCLLERGTERLPGSFPSTLAQLPTEVRFFAHTSNDTPLSNEPKVRGNRSGLFDIRVGDGQSVLVGNGLGGGSLINAGVMLQPSDTVFADSVWPTAIRNDKSLDTTFKESLELVGATVGNAPHHEKPINVDLLTKKLQKFDALDKLGASENGAEAVPITVKLTDDISNQAIETDTCIQCGDCFSGCNHNAKRSLDTNLLAKAAIAGAELYCGATVLSFDKLESGLWELTCTYTDEPMQKHLQEFVKIRCEKLVIAAGTLGSTELLLRSQKHSKSNLQFSDHLGKHFSGNGDMIANISDNKRSVNAVASESVAPSKRNIGPTITGMIDLRESDTPAVVQELAVPALLRRVLVQTTAFTQTIDAITSICKGWAKFSERFCTINPLGPVGPGDKGPSDEVLGMQDAETDRIAILAVMGQDNMEGRMFLPPKSHEECSKTNNGCLTAQGVLAIEFPVSPNGDPSDITNSTKAKTKKNDPTFYDKNMRRLKKLLKKSDRRAWLHANPLWKPLGAVLESMFEVEAQGMQITVHPLGGCAMGESNQHGVVNHIGEVFDQCSTDNSAVHSGLVVLDGSIIPKALGVNPALTISALALRATHQLANNWNWKEDSSALANNSTSISRVRPVLKNVPKDTVKNKASTKVELVERLIGEVTLKINDESLPCVVELRLRSEPFNIVDYSRFKERSLPLLETPRLDANNLLPSQSVIRIFAKKDWDENHNIASIMDARDNNPNSWAINKRALLDRYDETLDDLALLSGTLTGSIQLLEEKPLNPLYRFLVGIYAWHRNRGKRDRKQSQDEKSSIFGGLETISKYFGLGTLAAFLHTGRERRFSYNLVIGQTVSKDTLRDTRFTGNRIRGTKSFAYRRRSNPWRQLMDIQLSDFPNADSSREMTLSVDPGFFARTQAPLFHIVDEDNAIDGTADIVDFYAHMARVFAIQQLWIFRKPDTPEPPPPTSRQGVTVRRLPAVLRDVQRESYKLNISGTVNSVKSQFPVQAQLTRFKPKGITSKFPVLCIHGYSASGSTYSHNSLYGGEGKTGGLAKFLVDKGHDVWVLDMRSSSAFTCAQSPWDFEHMAYNDIPLAIQEVLNRTEAEKVDVVAHCMGAAMLSMTLLGKSKDPDQQQRISDTQNSINKIVLSQAGPFFKFTPMNTMRAWVLGFVKELLPRDGYAFNPKAEASDWETIMDRLLTTLPYPDNSEFDRENPTVGYRKWVRTRRRMDALYGKTFSLSSMSDDILDHIDDYFGPFSFQTLEQTLPISKRGQISNRYGSDFNITPEVLRKRWDFPTLWIHGADNGLIDPISPSLTALRFDEAQNTNLTVKIIADTGHQDCLMGKNCQEPFRAIAEHLGKNTATDSGSAVDVTEVPA